MCTTCGKSNSYLAKLSNELRIKIGYLIIFILDGCYITLSKVSYINFLWLQSLLHPVYMCHAELMETVNACFSLKNIDNDALSEGLRLQDEETLKSVAGQITLSVHTLTDNVEVRPGSSELDLEIVYILTVQTHSAEVIVFIFTDIFIGVF